MTACLSGSLGVLPGLLEIAIRVALVPKRAADQTWHAPHMPGGEGNPKAIRSRVRVTLDRVSPEVVIFALLPVRNHRRARCLKLGDRVPDRFRVERLETLIHACTRRSDGINERLRPWDAADGFCGNYHALQSARRRDSAHFNALRSGVLAPARPRREEPVAGRPQPLKRRRLAMLAMSSGASMGLDRCML